MSTEQKAEKRTLSVRPEGVDIKTKLTGKGTSAVSNFWVIFESEI
jgi:hypothetical protein